MRRWLKLLARVEPDLIHANDFHNARSISLAAAYRRTPVVCHIRFHQHESYLRWVFRGLPKPAAFIHNSQATSDVVGRSLRATCRAAIQVVIHNGVATDRFVPASPPKPQIGPFRIGIVGNLIPIKGHLEFLQMARHLSDQEFDAQYWVVGEDIHGTGYRALLERRTRELQLDDRVTFFGHSSNVAELMQQLHVLVCASHVEPFGINVIEGMACELPIVGTRVGGIPEIIDDGVTGLLVSPKDAVELAKAVAALLRDPGRRRAMGQAGRQRVRTFFSMEKHTADVVRLYQRVRDTKRRTTTDGGTASYCF
jgi:glycosyltransferase involved in cell wall biosynthesis